MLKKNKIIYILPTLNRGGAELLVLQLCKGLKKKNSAIIIKIIVLYEKGVLSELFENNGIEVKTLLLRKVNGVKKIIKTWREINRFKPDVVHTHLLPADKIGLIAAFLCGVKYRISTAHNMEPTDRFPDKLARIVASVFSHNIIAVSNSARDFYIKKRFYPKRKIKVVYNAPGVDLTYVGNINRKVVSPIQVISIGKYAPQKGQIYLIRAMTELEKTGIDYRLSIFGSSLTDYKKKLNDEVNRLNLSNVFMYDATSKLQRVFERAHILVASSLWESFHMVLVEAMYTGIPIVATDIPPHREVLKGIDPCVFVPVKSSKAIAEKIQLLASNTTLYKKIESQMLKRAPYFSIDKMVDSHYTIYTSNFQS